MSARAPERAPTAPAFVTPHDLRAMLGDCGELALIDLREELIFSQRHLPHARSVPLSRLELRFAQLVPRRSTRIVLIDDNEGLATRAAVLIRRNGYGNVTVLEGGADGWEAAGFELFSGVHVPSKAFGEFVEHESRTPSIAADELEQLLRERADVVVLDSRPFDEYSRVSIPTAVNVPGAELVLRVRDLAPSPQTMVVVNCAGRTRSIIGAQSLINAGVPNKVVALRNGTMGWTLAGFTCDHDKDRRAPNVSAAARAWARQAAQRVAQRCGVERIDRRTLETWRGEEARTLYLFDVRDPGEYAAGHVAGAISAPGGQLVQATDYYVGTLCARIVLVDDAEVRAAMTASWLRQMGWRDVFTLAEAGTETGWPKPPMLEAGTNPAAAIDCAALQDLLARDAATVIDLSLSKDYLAGHIPSSWFAIRSRLERALKKIPLRGMLVLTSEDGVLAQFAAPEAQALLDIPVRALAGGNAAWRNAGYAFSSEPAMADEPVDMWRKPYERGSDINVAKAAMNEYLTWETSLLPRIARDGSANFSAIGA